MEGINLEQAAKVFWWADGEIPDQGGFAWGKSDREFGRLRDAINFVFAELTYSERASARIIFDGLPGTLDFREAETIDLARTLLKY
jgi:hypothetical protein